MDCFNFDEDLQGQDECQTGGLKVYAHYTYYRNILTYPKPTTPTNFAESVSIADPFIMQNGTRFYRMEGDLEALNLTNNSQGGLNNLTADNRYKFRLSGTARQLVGFINANKNKPLTVIISNTAGNKRILGQDGLPAKIVEFKEISGEKTGDEKYIEFTVYAPGKLPYFYENDIPDTPQGNLRTDSEGNFRIDENGNYRLWQ